MLEFGVLIDIRDLLYFYRTTHVEESGECQQPSSGEVIVPTCACPVAYEPICGNDGRTYGNNCIATCRYTMKYTN